MGGCRGEIQEACWAIIGRTIEKRGFGREIEGIKRLMATVR